MPSSSQVFHSQLARLLSLGLFLGFSVAAHSASPQIPLGTQAPVSTPGLTPMGGLPITVSVNVREANGMPLEGHAFVKLSSKLKHYEATVGTQDNSTAVFNDVTSGDYDLEVTCAGYKTAVERINVFSAGSSVHPVFVYLHSESEITSATKPPPGMAMTPKLQAELDKGFEKMRKQQYDAAREHFEKAAKLAPANPDVAYLLGMTEYNQKHFDLARTKFQAALALYPDHVRSLLALGEVHVRTGDFTAACSTLEKAYQLNGADWRTHFLLAQAYNGATDYAKAAIHATRAAELGQDKAPQPLLLLGRVYAADHKPDAARKAFEMLVKAFPGDPAAAQAKSEMASLSALPSGDRATAQSSAAASAKPGAVASALDTVPASLPLLREIVERPWAPADVDSKEYPLAPNVACAQEDVLNRAQARVLHQLQNFEKFMATEHIEHAQVDQHGNEGGLRSRDFSYLVFVRPFKENSFFLEESRDGGLGVDSFPTSLATTGLVGLGVAILEQEYRNDFNYKCEGLSSWRGQAAWLMRFEQKKGVESRVRVWRRRGDLFPVALKGRVWLAANSYDLLHMESDLRDPIEKLVLTRDHLAIDYGPVAFETGNQKLWLPWKAEMFMEIHGRRYHHRHTLTDYMLFSVDTASQIGKPKLPPPEAEEKPQN